MALGFILAAILVVIVTLLVVAINPSSANSQNTTTSHIANTSTTTTAKPLSTTTSAITSQIASPATALASNFTEIATSNPIAVKFSALLAKISDNEAVAAKSAGVTYHSYIASPIVIDGSTPVALAAFSYDPSGLNVKIFADQGGSWSIVDQLPRPSDLSAPVDPSFPWMITANYSPGITVGDVTNNSTPTFMIPLSFADNIPGSFVIQTSSTSMTNWQYANFYQSGIKTPTNVLGRDAKFANSTIVSIYNDCNPDCASGHTANIYWIYDPKIMGFVEEG